jgi:tripartite-type tricarboxylate transporter receptor subunit TctC
VKTRTWPLALAALLAAASAAAQTASPLDKGSGGSVPALSSSKGQAYPVRPVRVIVPFAAGGNTDLTARLIGAKLSDVFGQQIVIENRPGGATNIGTELVAKAPPDGYTILMGGATNAINMSTQAKPPYDTLRDFAPVILCVQGANVLTIHPSVPARNLKDLIALARARPGQLNFASSGLGSSNQMAGELFKVMAKVSIVHVPYKGNAPALTDTLAGNVEMMFSGVPVVIPPIQSGRLRAIAIGSLKRFAAIPEVPTLDESGLKGYEATTWFGLMAPVKTPKEIVARWNVEVGRILASPDLKGRFLNEGLEPMGGTQDEFATFIRVEIEKYAKLVKASGMQPQ